MHGVRRAALAALARAGEDAPGTGPGLGRAAARLLPLPLPGGAARPEHTGAGGRETAVRGARGCGGLGRSGCAGPPR